MISSGLYLEKISEKIAVLKIEIEQSGKIGLTNLHKHCERFLTGLLNIVYDLRLQDLDVDVPNYPALNAGDKGNSVAYQITSERSSAKINETLSLVERYKHYTEFNRIVIFILGQRQSSYKVNGIRGDL